MKSTTRRFLPTAPRDRFALRDHFDLETDSAFSREESPSMPKNRLLIILAALFIFQLAVGYVVVDTVNRQGVLVGEEASVNFRDAAMLPQRLQHNPLATSFGLQVFYWAGSHLTPGFDLFYGRWWKATFMALLPPLLFLYGRKRVPAGCICSQTPGGSDGGCYRSCQKSFARTRGPP